MLFGLTLLQEEYRVLTLLGLLPCQSHLSSTYIILFTLFNNPPIFALKADQAFIAQVHPSETGSLLGSVVVPT